MNKTKLFISCLMLLAVVAAMLTAETRATQIEMSEEDLIAILESDAPPQDKAITCKQLAVVGSPAAVPALAKLLPDPELSSWTRIALEVIPGPEADQALRDALDQIEGRLLIGIINSVAVRHDQQAVDQLIQQLENDHADVAAAAAVALGCLGSETACQALQQALDTDRAPVRSAVAEGCIRCAERYLDNDKAAAAAKLYDQVRQADVPQQRLLEATRGAILAQGSEGIPLLVEQLKSDDKAFFQLGLMTAREIPGTAVTEAIASQLEQASPIRQSLLIMALADRSDDKVLPAVLQVAQSGPDAVRLVAIDALQQVGDASCVPVLLEIALNSESELSQKAKEALENLAGSDVNQDLVNRLEQATDKMRPVVIEVVGRRRIKDAVPSLLKAVDHSDADVRSAALLALGETVGPANLSVLIQQAVTSGLASESEAEAAIKALRTACIRMPDRDACARQLAAAMPQAPLSVQCDVVEILGAMGGSEALKLVGAAAKSNEPALQDTASRLLGQWMSTDAAPVLLDLAQTADQSKYRIRALRGFLRIPRQFDVPVAEAVRMCRDAIDAAERDQERALALEVIGRYPSVGMLRLATELAKDPKLKSQAMATAVAIAEKLGAQSADVQLLLEQIGQESVKVEIVKAEYGAPGKFKDVTAALRKYVGDFPLIVLPSGYNASLGGDPAPGTKKELKIEYRIDGQSGQASFSENAPILLPTP